VTELDFFATCPSGADDLLETELIGCGATITSRNPTGVGFSGPLECAYRACLWSRVANRVLLNVAQFAAADGDELYEGCSHVDWSDHLDAGMSFAVDCTTRRSALRHSLFAAQRVKDAIVDQLRERSGSRPDVDLRAPDLRIHLHVQYDRATLAIDLSGASLHRRGYRLAGGVAPLKENLAAIVLLRAGWPTIAASGGALLDPLCGSGTLPIEAILMAADIAPNLDRPQFGFERWPQHVPALWRRLEEEARTRRAAGLERCQARSFGSDIDAEAVAIARRNVACLGLDTFVSIEQRALGDVHPPARYGLLVTNPPYGARLGDSTALPALFDSLGTLLRERFAGWRAAVLSPTAELGYRIGLRVAKRNALKNGAIDVTLFCFDVSAANERRGSAQRPTPPEPAGSAEDTTAVAARLRKNLKHLGRWARHRGITCYRIYDADLPDYAFAIDQYRTEQGEIWLYVQEYAAPPSVDPTRAAARRAALLAVLPRLLDIAPERICARTRTRQRGRRQYQREATSDRLLVVEEGGCRLLVNLADRIDTGLFLDHRPLRLAIGAASAGRTFLSLFAYTAAATVHAVRGGATASTSVDLSNTYLDWARRNLELNEADLDRHRLVRADCRDWLDAATTGSERYDTILLDPPSFSNSKDVADLDVQRDHVALIRAAMRLLATDGTLYFSTHLTRFRFDATALADLDCEDIRARTLDEDFRRNPRIHACWKICHRPA
jgi:23S rRNA (guanine2445-N2)-methyltransferase / 23S rRNA (guanine2069-N7)-methyltransferase